MSSSKPHRTRPQLESVNEIHNEHCPNKNGHLHDPSFCTKIKNLKGEGEAERQHQNSHSMKEPPCPKLLVGPTGDRPGAFVFTLGIFDCGLPEDVHNPPQRPTNARTSIPTEGFAAEQRPPCARSPWAIQPDRSFLKRNSGCYKRRADSRGCKVGSTFRLVGGNILSEWQHQIINNEQRGVKVLFTGFKLIIYIVPPALQTVAMYAPNSTFF